MPFFFRCAARYVADLTEQRGWDIIPLVGSIIFLRIFNPAILFPERNKKNNRKGFGFKR